LRYRTLYTNTSCFTDSQIIAILWQAAGNPMPALCHESGTSNATFYK